MKEKAIIVDVDDTLASTTKRNHLAKEKKWNEFFEEAKHDDPIVEIIELVKRYSADHNIILCTGRPEDYRELTEKWLAENNISYQKLFMRDKNNFSADDIVKETIYKKEIEPHYDISFVLDDRQIVVDMWRRLGLRCLQVAPSNF